MALPLLLSPLTVQGALTALNSGQITAEHLTEECLKKIKEQDPNIGAFLETFDDRALTQARAIDQARLTGAPLGRLAGVPVAIKDNLLLKGELATAGCKILKDHRAAYTATVVAKLEAAGAIILGRLNMDECAMGSSTETSAWQLTRNPRDTTRIPGGSSGGPAAAVAAGFVAATLGTDTGGSVRQPASLCGVVGLKPTYGRVSRYGMIALASSFDQVGVFAHTVEDVMRVMEVIEGQDDFDLTSQPLPDQPLAELVNRDLAGLRIGVPAEYFTDTMDPDSKLAVETALEKFKTAGAILVPISLPLTKFALPTYYIIQPAEASSNLGRYDGLRYGTRAPGKLSESYLTARSIGFGREVKRRIMLGAFILSAGYYDAYYKKALAVQAELKQEFINAFKTVDVIASPTSPAVAWKFGEIQDPITMYLSDIMTAPANIAGIPAISVPCGLSQGLPVGLQLQANHFAEATLYRAAAGYLKVAGYTPTVGNS